MSGQTRPGLLKIALLDDHDVVRHGSLVHLSKDPRFDVVGSHAHSRELLTTLAGTGADIAVIDYVLGNDDLPGLALLHVLRQRFPQVRPLLFTAHASRVMLSAAIGAGAAGVVTKNEPLAALSIAATQVAAGLRRLPDGLADEPQPASLSPSERDVLQMCLAGMTVSEIALRRNRSVKTISTQKQNAFRKLGLRSDGDLYMLRHQLAWL